MASGRQPRNKSGENKPEILRAIRVGDKGDVYGPGEEQDLLDALKEHEKAFNANPANKDNKFSHKDELYRLHEIGHLVNFKGINVEDEDIDHDSGDRDLHANQRAAQLAETGRVGEEGDGMTTSRVRRSRARIRRTEGVESGDNERDDDGSGDELAEANS